MKKSIIIIILGAITLISCSNPSSSNNILKPKEYSIIFSGADFILGESYALGVINPDGTGLKKIGPGLSCYFSFSASDDGLTAVYLNRSINNPYITVSNLTNMTDNQFSDIENADNPIISPNGKYIVFKSHNTSGLYTMNIDGSNRKNLAPQYNTNYYKWSSDSKGIIFAGKESSPSFPETAYYIDKDGINDPVEAENPFVHYSILDLEYYPLDQFTRADLPSLPDSVGFIPVQFNKPKNKAWYFFSLIDFARRPPLVTSHLLGYNLSTETEKMIIDNCGILSSLTVSWSPNDEDIAAFTQKGLEVVKVDGTRNKILNFNLSQGQQSMIYHKWIPGSI